MSHPSETVTNVAEWIESLGGLHDVRVKNITILPMHRGIVELHVTDLYANFEGLSNYVERPCIIRFLDVKDVFLDIDFHEGVRIGDAEVESAGDAWKVRIDLNLGGGMKSKGENSIVLSVKSTEIIKI